MPLLARIRSQIERPTGFVNNGYTEAQHHEFWAMWWVASIAVSNKKKRKRDGKEIPTSAQLEKRWTNSKGLPNGDSFREQHATVEQASLGKSSLWNPTCLSFGAGFRSVSIKLWLQQVEVNEFSTSWQGKTTAAAWASCLIAVQRFLPGKAWVSHGQLDGHDMYDWGALELGWQRLKQTQGTATQFFIN